VIPVVYYAAMHKRLHLLRVKEEIY